MNIIEQVINNLSHKGFISSIPFVITDELRAEYAKEYEKLTGGNFSALKLSNKKYALKLAGLNLLLVSGTTTSGFVYCIRNPSFPKHVKVGITKDVNKRLASYQTYDPYRAFYIDTYRFVEDKRAIEKYLLTTYKVNLDLGEWVSDLSVVDYVKSFS